MARSNRESRCRAAARPFYHLSLILTRRTCSEKCQKAADFTNGMMLPQHSTDAAA